MRDNELLVRAPTVMRGYYNKPDATRAVMTEDGFLRTGDAGSVDAEGHVYFLERIKELTKTSYWSVENLNAADSRAATFTSEAGHPPREGLVRGAWRFARSNQGLLASDVLPR